MRAGRLPPPDFTLRHYPGGYCLDILKLSFPPPCIRPKRRAESPQLAYLRPMQPMLRAGFYNAGQPGGGSRPR